MLSVTRVLSWKLCVPLHLISNNSQTLKFWWKCYARWIRQTARDFVNALWTKHCIGGASKADGHPLLLVVGRTPAGPISEYSAPWSPSTTTSYTQKRQKFLLPPKLQRRGLVFKRKLVTLERVWWVTVERVWWVTTIVLEGLLICVYEWVREGLLYRELPKSWHCQKGGGGRTHAKIFWWIW